MTSPDSADGDGRPEDPREWRDDVLRRALDGAGDGGWGPVVVLGSTGSTNADAADQVAEGAPEGFTVVADEQTAGRGRLDRTWTSPYGAGLAMSVVLRPVVPDESWGWVPLTAGLAVVEALARQGLRCGLKWPNDVVVPGPDRAGGPGPRKLGGILVERVGRALVVGIGVNTGLRADELPVPTATSARLEGVAVSRERLVVDVLDALRGRYARWQQGQGDARRTGLLDEYGAACVTLGAEVRALLPGERSVEGTAYAIDDQGRLLVRTGGGGTESVSAGDVTHLR